MHWHQLAAQLNALSPIVLPCARVAMVLATIAVAYLLIYLAGVIRMSPFARLMCLLLILAAAGAASYAVCTLAPLLVAKGALVICLIGGGLFCFLLVCLVPKIDIALTSLQRDCELATQLCYMQGEMTRAQLEEINARLQQATQPQEREITESMLRTLSPLVMMYFRKEKNIIKWSMAAVKVGRGVFDYFFKD
jgi:hypothetical protein